MHVNLTLVSNTLLSHSLTKHTFFSQTYIMSTSLNALAVLFVPSSALTLKSTDL